MSSAPGATVVVEGRLDEVVMHRLAGEVGFEIWRILGRRGKAFIRERIRGYASAARGSPWVVVCDLDADAPCANARFVRATLGDLLRPISQPAGIGRAAEEISVVLVDEKIPAVRQDWPAPARHRRPQW